MFLFLKLLLMAEILHQLRLVLVAHPIICRVSYIPGGAGFLPSFGNAHQTLGFASDCFFFYNASPPFAEVVVIMFQSTQKRLLKI